MKTDVNQLKGKVQTVLGLIEPGAMGITLPHEHLFIDMSSFFVPPDDEYAPLADQPITLENLGWVRSHRMSHRHNLLPFTEEEAIHEVGLFKKASGSTIAEQTPINVGRNPEKIARVSRATGVNILMGTSYYREMAVATAGPLDKKWPSTKLGSYPSEFIQATTEDELAAKLVRDIIEGENDIRAGFIGEIGCSYPLTANERKVLRAAVAAQKQTGALFTIHPGFCEDSPPELARILKETGADLTRTVMSHMSIAVGTHRTRCQLADMGLYLEWDLFGWDGLYPQQPTPLDIPGDQGQIRQIMDIIREDYLERVLISHDICARVRLSHYGGSGYSHILETITPLMLQKGMTEDQIKTITVDNPRRAFTFV